MSNKNIHISSGVGIGKRAKRRISIFVKINK